MGFANWGGHMADLKTKKTDVDPRKHIDSVKHDGRRNDSLKLLEFFESWTGQKPAMWGERLIGFGDRHYKYESGHEGDWFYVGFSPTKSNLSIHTNAPNAENQEFLDKLGKHKTGASCIYVNKLEDIDLKVLEKIVKNSVKVLQKSE